MKIAHPRSSATEILRDVRRAYRMMTFATAAILRPILSCTATRIPRSRSHLLSADCLTLLRLKNGSFDLYPLASHVP